MYIYILSESSAGSLFFLSAPFLCHAYPWQQSCAALYHNHARNHTHHYLISCSHCLIPSQLISTCHPCIHIVSCTDRRWSCLRGWVPWVSEGARIVSRLTRSQVRIVTTCLRFVDRLSQNMI